ncbi:MAG: hypothetical protein OEV64_08400 [Desulfobulbaceae bacterium]|nr:hypothetical protein [Desulfobulbaceae bacterium]
MNLYLIFHHNLAFSSIPEEHYSYLIDSVYSRLLDLVELGYPLGLEYTGETLEIINRLRPQYIERLCLAWRSGACEVVGSSYSQAIFPLIPAEVNRWNLVYGQAVYKELLGQAPNVFYLNEQVYSESLPILYREVGAQAVVFDWMSACKENDWPPDFRYRSVRHAPSGMELLWGDSIAFQKFQRAVWGDISGHEWLKFIITHQELGQRLLLGQSCFCLYASDAEVFDYHPGRLTTCGARQGHFESLQNLLASVGDIGGKLVVPSKVLGNPLLDIPAVGGVATAAYPIRTKKQDKYNVTRWAVTGREAAKMNTLCHQLLEDLREIGNGMEHEGQVARLKKELVVLWGSDFRTHTTDEKYDAFRQRMGAALTDAQRLLGVRGAAARVGLGVGVGQGEWRPLASQQKTESSKIEVQGRLLRVVTEHVELALLLNKGLALESLGFPSSGYGALVGTIPHGHFSDISLGSDFFSGHLVLITQEGRQHTDLSCSVDALEICESVNGFGLRNRKPMELPGLSIVKTYWVDSGQLTLVYDLYAKDLRPASLRLGMWTILPWGFDHETFYYQCHQGGDLPERYRLGKSSVLQDMAVNSVVTSRHCLGNTSGVLCLGDVEKCIEIKTSASELYSVPLLHHEMARAWDHSESFFARAYYSVCERDDVANVFWKGHLRISFCLRATRA